MSKIKKIIRRGLRGYDLHIRTRARRCRAFLDAWLHDGHLLMSKKCIFYAPLSVNGKGNVTLADDVQLGYGMAPKLGDGALLLQARRADSSIAIGSGTAIGNNCSIIAERAVTIGSRCLIGHCVSIYDSDFHGVNPTERRGHGGVTEAVTLGDNVWLGSHVLVLRGVNIGENSVIAAGAVVVKSIPPNVLAGGVPAKVIRGLI